LRILAESKDFSYLIVTLMMQTFFPAVVLCLFFITSFFILSGYDMEGNACGGVKAQVCGGRKPVDVIN
jgi:ascorbate-specific PTS system EIIC-type component UlaA